MKRLGSTLMDGPMAKASETVAKKASKTPPPPAKPSKVVSEKNVVPPKPKAKNSLGMTISSIGKLGIAVALYQLGAALISVFSPDDSRRQVAELEKDVARLKKEIEAAKEYEAEMNASQAPSLGVEDFVLTLVAAGVAVAADLTAPKE